MDPRLASPCYRSVCFCESDTIFGRLPAHEALARRLSVRIDSADRDAGRLRLQTILTCFVAAPEHPHEPRALFEMRHDLGQSRQLERVLPLEGQGTVEQLLLKRVQFGLQAMRDA